ncbi:MAG: hypothetical protein QF704_03435 [Anaerolineales bacterium]|jgi:hypothetical protein|nr:hypothetical protein [Anaerolineales bacterium]
MATWKKVLTESHIGTDINGIIGTDTDIDCGTDEAINQINVTDGVITSMSKQTIDVGWTGVSGIDDGEFMVVDDMVARDFHTKTAAEVLTTLGIEANADVTDADNVNAAGAVMNSDYDATTFMYATSDNTPQAKTPSQVRAILGVENNSTGDQTASEILTLLEDGIDSVHYKNGSIDNEHLADNAVNSAELASGAVDDAHLSNGVASGLAGTGLTASSGVISVDASQGITSVTGNFAVGGDLTVSGDTITTSTETLEIANNTMVLNSDYTGNVAADAGIVVQMGGVSGNNPSIWFDCIQGAGASDTTGRWVVGSTDDATTVIGGYVADVMQVRIDGNTPGTSSDVPIGHMQYHSGELYVRVED